MGDERAEASTVDDETLTSLRLPTSLLDRAAALVDDLKQQPQFSVQRVSRSTVIRLALLLGLDALEAELAPPKAKKKKRATRA